MLPSCRLSTNDLDLALYFLDPDTFWGQVMSGMEVVS